MDIQLNAAQPTNATTLPPSKVKWEKVDKAQYKDLVTESVLAVNSASTSMGALDTEIRKLNQILVKASEQSGPAR